MAKTGYKIITYIDVNPQSPTFSTTREERVVDSECNAEGSSWEVVSSYCEVDGNGAHTGYYVTTEMDTNLESPTYGQTSDSRSYSPSQCPLPSTDPQWAINEEDSYCETVTFPSGLDGNTGRYIVSMTDENRNSSTYEQTIESAFTESAWTEDFIEAYGEFPCESADTTPKLEILSESCQLVVQDDGTVATNGYKDILGIDRNPYSWTYLSAVTQTVEDQEKCPTAKVYVFKLDDYGTYRHESIEYNKNQILYDLTSTFNGENIGYTIAKDCSWILALPHTNFLTLSFEKNTSEEVRNCEVLLTQNGSGKKITIDVTQEHMAEVDVYAYADKYMLDGTSAATFTIHYYAMADSSKITDGVVLESIPLEADEEAFPYTVASSGTDNIGNYISYNVDANNVNRVKTAKFKATYNGKYSNLVVIKQSGREMVILPDFDYLTFTFNWNEADGKDLDSATFVEGTNYIISGNNRTAALDDCPVGYGCKGSDRSFSANTRQYLEYGGDNRNSGDECALVNWKTICNHDFISEGITTLYCNLYANWYEEKTNGNCSVTFKTYKGEGMQHGGMVDGQWNEYVFVPSGNTELVSTQTISGSCYAFSSNNSRQRYYSPTADEKGYYSYIAEFVYDIQTKTAFMSNKMLPITGRELKKYGVVDDVLITGNGSDTLGIATMSYDAAARTVTINNIKDFHVVATTPNESITEQATAYTMSLSFDPSGTEWATATFENNTLVVNMDENDSGRFRTAEVSIVGKTLLSDVEYRFRLRQNLY